MKTKFSITHETFNSIHSLRYRVTIEMIKEMFETNYKNDGWVLDIEKTDFYKLFDEFIDYLKIGDTVIVANNTEKSVYDKHYDFVNNMVVYYLMPKAEYLYLEKNKQNQYVSFNKNRPT